MWPFSPRKVCHISLAWHSTMKTCLEVHSRSMLWNLPTHRRRRMRPDWWIKSTPLTLKQNPHRQTWPPLSPVMIDCFDGQLFFDCFAPFDRTKQYESELFGCQNQRPRLQAGVCASDGWQTSDGVIRQWQVCVGQADGGRGLWSQCCPSFHRHQLLTRQTMRTKRWVLQCLEFDLTFNL